MHDSDKIWYIVLVTWLNLPQKDANVSHLTRTVSLHYLVKLKGLSCVEIPMLENNKIKNFYKHYTFNKHVQATAYDKDCKYFHVLELK